MRIVYADSDPEGLGTLFLPEHVGLSSRTLRTARKPKQLVDYLLSAEVEQRLAAGRSAQIPLNRNSTPNERIKGPAQLKAMKVDFAAAAAAFNSARETVEKDFLD